MTRYCLFRLYGPIVSYGGTAVGEDRHSYGHPSKSAVLGLVAGALGIRRSDEVANRNLSENLGFSVIIENSGIPVRDYHTVQFTKTSLLKKQSHIRTRKDEMDVGRENLSGIVTKRDYLCDLVTTICLWSRKNESQYSLEDISSALSNPVFVPYLGRKSCPVALPFRPEIVTADSIKDAYLKSELFGDNTLNLLTRNEKSKCQIFWDNDGVSGVKPEEEHIRRDNVLSRKRWQFSDRKELFGRIELPGSGT